MIQSILATIGHHLPSWEHGTHARAQKTIRPDHVPRVPSFTLYVYSQAAYLRAQRPVHVARTQVHGPSIALADAAP